jgi:ABC-type dipeptide/oligopeptide/nickel transport system ATPase component
VLEGVNLTVGATETVALVGESGCGKTLTGRTDGTVPGRRHRHRVRQH